MVCERWTNSSVGHSGVKQYINYWEQGCWLDFCCALIVPSDSDELDTCPQGPKLFLAWNLHSGRIWWNKRMSGKVCRDVCPCVNTPGSKLLTNPTQVSLRSGLWNNGQEGNWHLTRSLEGAVYPPFCHFLPFKASSQNFCHDHVHVWLKSYWQHTLRLDHQQTKVNKWTSITDESISLMISSFIFVHWSCRTHPLFKQLYFP